MTLRARKENLLVQTLDDETLVFDRDDNTCHVLNKAAAIVWQQCDGTSSVSDIAAVVAAETGLPADEQVVHLALEQLDDAKLLQERAPASARLQDVSRRSLLRRVGVAAGLGLLLPMVETTIVPKPAMAASGDPPVTTTTYWD